jgi:hypothetical protein
MESFETADLRSKQWPKEPWQSLETVVATLAAAGSAGDADVPLTDALGSAEGSLPLEESAE